MSEPTENIGMHQNASPRLFQFARELRERETKAEELLWENLKMKRLDGFKFRRQHPLSRFIVDFYCHKMKLAIELDGGYHEKTEQREYDRMRTEHLTAIGVREIRFKNEEVEKGLEGVLEIIRQCLQAARTPGP